MSRHVEFSLLGGVSAYVDGRPVRLGRRRERLLLGVLLLEPGRPVPAQRLTDLLWDDDPDIDHRGHLHTAVARLRRILMAHGVVLTSIGGRYTIDIDPQRVDVHRFAAEVSAARDVADPARRMAVLGDAIARWRGEPLADVASDRIRDRIGRSLSELYLSAIEWRSEAALAAGRAADVIAELSDAVTRHPTRERFTALVMIALARLGRPNDALAAYREIYDRLNAEFGTQPGPELQGLQVLILRGDDLAVFDAPAAPGPTPPAAPGPTPPATPASALPRDLPGFVGRQEQLEWLTRQMTSGGPTPIVVISGPGGVGKTTLATHWAHAMQDHFPHGRFHVDIRGFSGIPPRSTADAVTRLLGALGVAASAVPPDVDAALGLYQERLAGRRVLVVVDNAATADQVRPLIPTGNGCAVLVTSRRRLDGLVVRDGARSLALQPMSVTESLDVLRDVLNARRVRDEHHSAVELVELCGALPLAVRIAAANLAARPDQPIAAYCGRLRTSRLDTLRIPDDADAALRVTLRYTYDTLADPERGALRLLGLYQGDDIDLKAAAALLRMDRSAAYDILVRLADAHLLRQLDADRYAWHDMVREFAVEQLDAQEPARDAESARARLLGHYVASADRAMTVFLPALSGKLARDPVPTGAAPISFDDPSTARAWLDAESGNLVAEAHAAARSGPHRVAVHLADILLGYFLSRRHASRLLTLTEAAVAAATADGDQVMLARALRCLGTAHLQGTGDYASAERTLRRAVTISRKLGDLEGTANTLLNLAGVARETGRIRDARTYGAEALDAAEAAGSAASQANALFMLGASSSDLADWPAALAYAARAVHWYTDAEAPHGVDHAMLLESEALMEIGDLSGALARAQHALGRSRDAGFEMIQVLALAQLAVVADRDGRYHDGIAHAEEAMRLADSSANPAVLAHCRIYRGDLLLHLGETAAAEEDYRVALQVAETANQPHATILGHLGLARIAAARDQRDVARRHAALARDAAANTELVGLQAKAAAMCEEVSAAAV